MPHRVFKLSPSLMVKSFLSVLFAITSGVIINGANSVSSNLDQVIHNTAKLDAVIATQQEFKVAEKARIIRDSQILTAINKIQVHNEYMVKYMDNQHR